MRHGEQMHRRRILPLMLAALFAVPGCVSVHPPAAGPRPAPGTASPAAHTTPAPHIEEAEAARTALVDTRPEPQPRKARPAPNAEKHQADEHQAAVYEPSPARRRTAAPTKPRPAQQPAAPRKTARPPAHRPTHHHAPRAQSTYDMKVLCRSAADTNVSPAIVSLCRSSYGN